MSPLHARLPLLPLVLCAGVLTACGDRSPVAPEAPAPVPAAVMSSTVAAESSGPSDTEDLADLLDRVLPSIGDLPGSNALTVHVRRLQQLASQGATDDVRRHAAVGLTLLDAVTHSDNGDASAELGVIRLVLENRL